MAPEPADGLILIALSPLLPESTRFLQQMGRGAEARAMLARFGVTAVPAGDEIGEPELEDHPHLPPLEPHRFGVTVALTLAALAWSLVNFGLLLWLPGELVAEGRTVGRAA